MRRFITGFVLALVVCATSMSGVAFANTSEEPVVGSTVPEFVKQNMTVTDIEALTDAERLEYQQYLESTVLTTNTETESDVSAHLPVNQSIFYGEQKFEVTEAGEAVIAIQVKPEREAILEPRYVVTVYTTDSLKEKVLLDTVVVEIPQTLIPNEWTDVVVRYQPPALLSHFAEQIEIVLEMTTKFGANLIPPSAHGQMSLPSPTDYTQPRVLLSSCLLEVVGAGETIFSLGTGIDIKADETPSIICDAYVESPLGAQIDTYVHEEAFLRGVGSQQSVGTFVAKDPLVLAVGDAVSTVRIPIHRTGNTKAQAYDSLVTLHSPTGEQISNSVVVHYVVTGRSGSVMGVYPDKIAYEAGETAYVRIMVAGNTSVFPGMRYEGEQSKELSVLAIMKDSASGDECGRVDNLPVTYDSVHIMAEIPVNAACPTPQFEVSLHDAEGELATYTEGVDTSSENSAASQESEGFFAKMSVLQIVLLVIVILAVIALGVFLLWWKGIPPFRKEMLMLLISLATFFPATEVWAANAVGFFDATNGANTSTCKVSGWAYDPDSSATSINVDVYRGASAFAGGTFVATCATNLARTDVNNAYGITGNHGFDCTLAAAVFPRNTTHSVYVHAIDTTGSPNNVITNSPLTLNCPAVAAGVCGSANSVSIVTYPGSNHCSVGTPTATDNVGADNTYNWTCAGLNGGTTVSCSAPKTTSGQCGSATQVTHTSQPTTNLCTTGNQAWIDSAASDGTYNWNCNGINGGTNAACVATKSAVATPVNGVCGVANGGTTGSYPTVNNCSAGTWVTDDSVASDNIFNWRCTGLNGGTTASCSSNKALLQPAAANLPGGNMQGFFDGWATAGCRVGGWIVDLDSVNVDIKVGLHIETANGSVPVASCTTNILRSDVTNTFSFSGLTRTSLGFECPMPTNALAGQTIKAYAQDANNANAWYPIPYTTTVTQTDTTKCNPDASVTVGNYTCTDGVFNAITGGYTYDRAGRYCASVVSPTYTTGDTNINTYLTNMTCGNADYLRGRPSFYIATLPYTSCGGANYCRLGNADVTHTDAYRNGTYVKSTAGANWINFYDNTAGNELAAQGAITSYRIGAPITPGTYYLESPFAGISGVNTGFQVITRLYEPFTVTAAAPATPTGIISGAGCVASTPKVDLSWNASSGATSYDVQWCQGAACTPSTVISSIADTSYVHTGRTAGTVYRYRVLARNAGGPSTYSVVSETIAQSCVAAPRLIICPASAPSITVGGSTALEARYWASLASVPDCTTAGYSTVTGSAAWSSSNTGIASVSGGIVTGIDVGSPNITATYSGQSAVKSVTVTAPVAPGTPTGFSTGGGCVATTPKVDLSWNATANATSYDMQWCTGSGCTPSTLVSGISPTLYAHTGLTAGTIYGYRVRATNAGGSSTYTATTYETAPNCTAPAPSLTFTANPLTTNPSDPSTLTWTVTGTADSCWASGGWTGWKAFSPGAHQEIVSPLTTTTYNIECWNAGVSSGLKTVTVTVTAPSCTGTAPSNATACSPTDPSVTIPYGIVPACLSGATKCHYTCDNGYTQVGASCVPTQCNDGVDNDADVLVDLLDPGCTDINDDSETNLAPDLIVDKRLVEQGDSVVLTYYPNGQTCTLTGGALNLTGLSAEGSPAPQPIDGRTTFTLTCQNGSDTVTVDVVPRGWES